MIEPQSLSFIDSVWLFLWVLIEPFWAIVPLLNPYIVLIVAVVLGVIPYARRAVTAKALLAAIIAYAAYLVSPMAFDLGPLPPEAGMIETYALLSVLMAEAWLVISCARLLQTMCKALWHVSQRGHRPHPVSPAPAFTPNFTMARMQPIALGLSRTLSVPSGSHTGAPSEK
jgi:hypothetical protein